MGLRKWAVLEQGFWFWPVGETMSSSLTSTRVLSGSSMAEFESRIRGENEYLGCRIDGFGLEGQEIISSQRLELRFPGEAFEKALVLRFLSWKGVSDK